MRFSVTTMPRSPMNVAVGGPLGRRCRPPPPRRGRRWPRRFPDGAALVAPPRAASASRPSGRPSGRVLPEDPAAAPASPGGNASGLGSGRPPGSNGRHSGVRGARGLADASPDFPAPGAAPRATTVPRRARRPLAARGGAAPAGPRPETTLAVGPTPRPRGRRWAPVAGAVADGRRAADADGAFVDAARIDGVFVDGTFLATAFVDGTFVDGTFVDVAFGAFGAFGALGPFGSLLMAGPPPGRPGGRSAVGSLPGSLTGSGPASPAVWLATSVSPEVATSSVDRPRREEVRVEDAERHGHAEPGDDPEAD